MNSKAYQKGYESYFDLETVNPYFEEPTSSDYKEWSNGWDAAYFEDTSNAETTKTDLVGYAAIMERKRA